MTARHHYSVLRLIPDASRGECVNFGLVVFLADRLDVRVHPELAKIRALNPNIDTGLLRALPTHLDSLLSPLTDTAARHRVLSTFPLFRASELGHFDCAAADYESNVSRLLERLVLTPSRPTIKYPSRLEATMKAAFKRSKLLADDPSQIHHRVVQNYPVAEAEGLSADFAIRNGKMHFTAALDLRGAESTLRQDKRGQAALKAMMLHRAQQRFRGCRRIGVYITEPSTREIVEQHIAMLCNDAHECFDFGIQEERAAYMERIQEAARG